MDVVLEELLHDQDDIAETAREYVINQIPTVDQLKSLTELPFEVSIREQEGRLILATGTSGGTFPAIDEEHLDDFLEINQNSRLCFHTHPSYTGEVGMKPSAGDILTHVDDVAASKGKQSLIATKDGIVVFTVDESISPRDASRTVLRATRMAKMENPELDPEAQTLDFSREVTDRVHEDLADYISMRLVPWEEAGDIVDANFAK